MSDATVEQPIPQGQVDVFPELIKDIEARRDKGVATYGEPLRTNNGRDPLIDLYQELLDAAVYIKQELMERADDRLATLEEACKAVCAVCEGTWADMNVIPALVGDDDYYHNSISGNLSGELGQLCWATEIRRLMEPVLDSEE